MGGEVGMRGDIPRPHFLMLLEKASSAVRARLAAENPQAATTIDGVMAEVVGGMRDEIRNSSPAFAAADARRPPPPAPENPQAATTIDGVMAEVVGGMRDEIRNSSPAFAAADAAVARPNRLRRIGESEIYQYARDRKVEESEISLVCDTPIDGGERALPDPGAEIVLILAKVAGLSSTTTKAILLLRAADRGMSTEDLERALMSFNRLY